MLPLAWPCLILLFSECRGTEIRGNVTYVLILISLAKPCSTLMVVQREIPTEGSFRGLSQSEGGSRME